MAFGAVLGKGKLGKASIISYHFAATLAFTPQPHELSATRSAS